MTRHNFSFYCNCVNWEPSDVDAPGGLDDLVDQIQKITYRTFCKYVDIEERKDIEKQLGYSQKILIMAKDWAVSYFRSKLHGQTVYGFVWSGIEYVFVEQQ